MLHSYQDSSTGEAALSLLRGRPIRTKLDMLPPAKDKMRDKSGSRISQKCTYIQTKRNQTHQVPVGDTLRSVCANVFMLEKEGPSTASNWPELIHPQWWEKMECSADVFLFQWNTKDWHSKGTKRTPKQTFMQRERRANLDNSICNERSEVDFVRRTE